MTATIILKRSSVAGKVPLATDLQTGELAVNISDGVLFTKDDSGNIIKFSSTNWKLYEFDMGSKPIRSKTFIILDSDVTTSSFVTILPSNVPATGRGTGDYEWDMANFSAKCLDGQIQVTVYFTGKVIGKRNLQYKVE